MSEKQRDKLISVRVSTKLYENLKYLNTLQRQQGNVYTLSDTINFVLQKTYFEIQKAQTTIGIFDS